MTSKSIAIQSQEGDALSLTLRWEDKCFKLIAHAEHEQLAAIAFTPASFAEVLIDIVMIEDSAFNLLTTPPLPSVTEGIMQLWFHKWDGAWWIVFEFKETPTNAMWQQNFLLPSMRALLHLFKNQ